MYWIKLTWYVVTNCIGGIIVGLTIYGMYNFIVNNI